MALDRLTKIAGPGIKTDTNWVGNNANFTGVTTTASSFNVGVTTIHSTLIEAHNIKSTGIITATGGSFSGNVTAVDGTFSGNVSIAGTLTYEDVTSIDSVGIITGKGADINGDLDVDGHTNLDNVSVAGVSTFNDNVRLLDGDRLQFGNSQDISIFHNGSHTLINKSGSGTGDLIFNVDQVTFKDTTGTDERLSTNSKGIKVGTGVTIESNGQAEIAGITTFYKDVHIKSASNRLYIGANDRISLIADPAHSYLRINGGHFQIHNNNFGVRSYDGNGSIILFYSPVNDGSGSGGPRLYHYHGAGHTYERLRTTTSGVNITGVTTTTGLAVTGVSTFTGAIDANGDLDVDGHTNLDNVSIAGVTTAAGILDATNTPASIRVAQDIQHKGDADTKITFPANDTISFDTAGNESFRIDSIGRLLHGTTSSLIQDYRYRAQIQRAGSNALDSGILGLYFTGSSGASAQNVATAIGFHKKESDGNALANNGGIGILRFNGFDGSNYVEAATIGVEVDGNAGTNDMPGRIEFSTTADGASSPTERLRIDSSGRVLIGTTTEGRVTADNLTVASSGHTGITIRSGTSSGGNISFSDGTSGDDENRGLVSYDHASNFMRFYTNAAERLRITSAGAVMINKTSSFGTVPLQVKGTSSGLSDGGQIFDIGTADGSSGTRLAFGVSEDNFGWIRSYESGVGGRDIVFAASDEKMRINSTGQVLIGSASSRNVGGSTTNSRLQIEGTSTNTSSLSLVNNEASTAAPFVFFGKTRGNSVGESGQIQSGDTLGGLSFIGADGTDTNNRSAEITAVVNGSPANNTIPTNLVFSTSAQNATQLAERFRIYYTNTGNGGIAKFTSPASGDMLNLQNNTASGQGLILGVDTNNDYTYLRNNTSSTYSMVFNVNGSERVRINPSGKLGIGFNFNYTMNTDSTNLVIGDGGGAKGITLWTASGADSQNISFQVNETLSRAEGEISYGPSGCSTVANRNAMMFRVNSAERLRITSGGQTRMNPPAANGSHSLISEKQALIGTKHFYSVFHTFSGGAGSINSPLAVNNKIPTNTCGTVEIMAGWANGNGLRYQKYSWIASGATAISQQFNDFNSRYGVSVSVSTPTMSISGDYVNWSFAFSDSQGSKMENLKIHFEYFHQFRVDG